MWRALNKPSLFSIFIVIACIGCHEAKKTFKFEESISIACSPEELKHGDSATLTIFQISHRDRQLVELNVQKLSNLASIAKRIEITDSHRDGLYRLQVFTVKPLNMTLIIDESHFFNLPPNTMPQTIRLHTTPSGTGD